MIERHERGCDMQRHGAFDALGLGDQLDAVTEFSRQADVFEPYVLDPLDAAMVEVGSGAEGDGGENGDLVCCVEAADIHGRIGFGIAKTLRVGDDFICGLFSGRVRALLDERGKQVKEAGPAIPVQVLGLSGVPMAGDQFLVVEDATQAREIAQRRERLDREAKSRRTSKGAVTLEDFMAQAQAGERRTLGIVIKADQGGPAEALADALAQLSTSEVAVEVIHRGVGAITESDILLARTSGAIIIGFHVRPDNNARAAAEREGVEIKLYRVIYDAVNDVRSALEGLLRPEEREVVLGEAEVRETFKVSRVGTVAGCYVRSGTISRQAKVRVVRDGREIYTGNIASLRRFKEDVREVKEGYECGIGIENFNDLKVGDRIESFRMEEVKRTLQPAVGGAVG